MIPGPLTPETDDWLTGLRDFAAAASAAAAPSAEAAAERSILAAALAAWLDTEWPGLRAEWLADRPGTAEPAIVLTTSPAGRDAAHGVLGRDDPLSRAWRHRFACVSERDYRLWCMRHPDPDHRLHVNHWSWIKTRVPPRRRADFGRWPLAAGESYWLHRTGTAGAGRDRRACHLWKWNGRLASLLQPFVVEGVSGL